MTNAYVLYTKTYDREEARRARNKTKNSEQMNKKLTHFQFLERLGMQLIWPREARELTQNKIQEHIHVRRGKRRASSVSIISSTSTIHETIKRKKLSIVKMDRMDHDFPQRRDSSFHPIVLARVGVVCQICNHFKDRNGNRVRTLIGVVKCAKCNIHLCSTCYNQFHRVNSPELSQYI